MGITETVVAEAVAALRLTSRQQSFYFGREVSDFTG